MGKVLDVIIIQAEMIKASGEEGLDVYYRLCTKKWEPVQWPTDWRRAILYHC